MSAGRVAVVTGAGRGIGRAHALTLAARGLTVVVNDIDAAPARDVVGEIQAEGGAAMADTTDVSSLDGGRGVVRGAIDRFGRIDVLVNNAGFASGGGDLEHPVETELDALLGVHLKGPLGAMSAAVGDMQRRGWGRIVNTVSEAALDARFVAGLGYGAAKAALWGATLAAAAEVEGSGITVNAVSPGARTRMNAELLDAGFRAGASDGLDLDPVHIAVVVAWLVSDAAADVNGRIVHAAGGEVREYTTTRSSRTDLVGHLRAAFG
jgi:NAD(P)-dependent dehydrogenase (short-subunit alcohol dehydrogenase family)